MDKDLEKALSSTELTEAELVDAVKRNQLSFGGALKIEDLYSQYEHAMTFELKRGLCDEYDKTYIPLTYDSNHDAEPLMAVSLYASSKNGNDPAAAVLLKLESLAIDGKIKGRLGPGLFSLDITEGKIVVSCIMVEPQTYMQLFNSGIDLDAEYGYTDET